MNTNCPQGTYYDLKTDTCVPFCRGCKTGVCENGECYSTPYNEKKENGLHEPPLQPPNEPGVNVIMTNVQRHSAASSCPVLAPLLRGSGSCADWMLI